MSNLRQLVDREQLKASDNVGEVQCFIRKGKGGFYVKSHSGKSLGGPYTKEKAKKRLQQIEYFKHKGG